MTGIRTRGEKIRHFVIKNVATHPNDIAKFTADQFGISRQAVNKHIKRLVDEQLLIKLGKTRSLSYKLLPLVKWRKDYILDKNLAEDVVWRRDIASQLGQLPENVLEIWEYGFTEMFNNAVDHSEGSKISIQIIKSAATTEIALYDDGVGIFKKIQDALNLLDERHAVLELSKGKFTTDPANHTGEGIFFSSRVFDGYQILSGGTYFSHTFGKIEDWILENNEHSSGTAVLMKLNNHTSRTIKKIFKKFTSKNHYGFTKTVVPVRLAQYGDDKLISRSQAKRLLARIDRFKSVIFDFQGVDSIGQAFADEVFRVFPLRHPEIELSVLKANTSVCNMISRAKEHE